MRKRQGALQRDLEQFVEVVRGSLERRLNAVNLDLLDVGLKEHQGSVITPGAEQYIIIGWANRPATGQTGAFTCRLGADIQTTSPEDVEPMVTDITMKLIEHFYPTGGA